MISIPKANEAHDNYPCWVKVRNSEGEILKPTIICNCGVYCGIGLHHVHADGRVTASFYHKEQEGQPVTHKGCGWHEYIKLDNYDLGEFLPEV